MFCKCLILNTEQVSAGVSGISGDEDVRHRENCILSVPHQPQPIVVIVESSVHREECIISPVCDYSRVSPPLSV